MSAVFSLRRCADEDGRTAGGKIVRIRRTRAADRTPYARPQPPAEEPVPESSGNPNWLSGLIYPARAIASGAGRILSAVFGPDSLSSSSSSSGGDCCSEDEDDASNAADVDLNKAFSSVNTKRVNMHLIKQLVIQQTFSREECYELTKLIRSRAVQLDGNLTNTGARNNAVMEARKWLEEKKSGSDSKLKMEDRIYATDHGALSLVTHGEKGSPADVAKSYMEARPTWSSRALKHIEFRTPSPVQNFKEIFHSHLQLSEDGGTIQAVGDSDAAKGTDPDVNSNQLHGCRLSHEMDGSRDSGTNYHALSVSVADQTLEPRHKETIDALDSSKERVDVTVPDNVRALSGSQDSTNILFQDSLQDATQSDPNHKRKDAPPLGRNLRARTKRGRGKNKII